MPDPALRGGDDRVSHKAYEGVCFPNPQARDAWSKRRGCLAPLSAPAAKCFAEDSGAAGVSSSSSKQTEKWPRQPCPVWVAKDRRGFSSGLRRSKRGGPVAPIPVRRGNFG
jgi:hypothetical protein